MKASRFSDAQKAFILKQGADGMPVADERHSPWGYRTSRRRECALTRQGRAAWSRAKQARLENIQDLKTLLTSCLRQQLAERSIASESNVQAYG